MVYDALFHFRMKQHYLGSNDSTVIIELQVKRDLDEWLNEMRQLQQSDSSNEVLLERSVWMAEPLLPSDCPSSFPMLREQMEHLTSLV